MTVMVAAPGRSNPRRKIAACHAAVCAALKRELGDRHGLGVSDFEVLERFAESPDRLSRA